MNALEMTILFEFLDRLADSMGNAGCNDYELPDTPEGWALRREVEAAMDEPGDCDRLSTYDWAVLSVLRDKLNMVLLEANARKEPS